MQALRWAILQLVWSTKGYSIKEMPVHFEKEFREPEGANSTTPPQKVKKKKKKGDGFSSTTLTRRIKENGEAPPKVVEFVLNDTKLPVRTGQEESYRVVRLGLAALEGKPAPETPAEFAHVLRSEFPEDATALKLADALSKQGGPLDTLRAQFEALASSVVSALGSLLAAVASITGKLDTVEGKLDRVESTLALVATTVKDVDAKSDVADYQRARDTRRIIRSQYKVGGFVVLVVGVVVHCQPAPTPAPPSQSAPAVTVNLGTAQTAGDVAFNVQLSEWLRGKIRGFGDAAMGKRPKAVRPMPHGGLPGQATAPCQGPETTLYGHCWLQIANQSAPCPPELFQEGNNCYAPSMMPEKQPGSETSQPPNPEQR